MARFRLPHDIQHLNLGGQRWPVYQQVIDIPEDLEGELRLAYPNVERVTTDLTNTAPPPPAADGRNKAN